MLSSLNRLVHTFERYLQMLSENKARLTEKLSYTRCALILQTRAIEDGEKWDREGKMVAGRLWTGTGVTERSRRVA